MNSDHFVDWLKAESAKSSAAALARALSVSPQAVSKWLNSEVKTISPKTIEALAKYRQEPLANTYRWLDLPMPKNASDPVDVERLKKRQDELERRLDEAMDLLESINVRMHGGFMRPSPLALFIQDQLYKAGYDLRDRQGYRQFMEMCSMSLDGDQVAVQRIISQLMGAAPIERRDYSYLSTVLMPILGRDWNTHYLMEQAINLEKDYGSF
ncbi:helix-turn-helix domain-containing protein [Adonisia turfae]|nr:helix-turn-helix domain-containing protein [Adonisia turfae]